MSLLDEIVAVATRLPDEDKQRLLSEAQRIAQSSSVTYPKQTNSAPFPQIAMNTDTMSFMDEARADWGEW